VRQTSRKHASSGRLQRSRVALLTNTYKDKYHYWEAVDLTRKLLLTSVVLLVGPDSLVQLWFVTTTGLAFLVLRDCRALTLPLPLPGPYPNPNPNLIPNE
jgi:hypothetical protein